jgi:hypothetical protein
MRVSLATAPSPRLSFAPSDRRRVFFAKSDIPLPDTTLRSLQADAQRALTARTSGIADLAASLGIAATVQPLAAGTFHVVHGLAIDGHLRYVVRSTLPELFIEDRSLFLEDWVGHWCDTVRVPKVHRIDFEQAGAPFDYMLQDAASGSTLRDLGDDILDRESSLLPALGRVLALAHQTQSSGAGLIDVSAPRVPARPIGLHDRWPEFIELNLTDHLATCARADLIDASAEKTILGRFEAMRPEIAGRPTRLLHGDPGNHNVFVDPATASITALVDWEDALVGDPLYDVAMWATFHPARRYRSFLAGYLQSSAFERSFFSLYFLRIAIAKTVHRLRFGIQDRPDRTPAHRRIQWGLGELTAALNDKPCEYF